MEQRCLYIFICILGPDGADREPDLPAVLHEEGGPADPGTGQSPGPHWKELHLDCHPGRHWQVFCYFG